MHTPKQQVKNNVRSDKSTLLQTTDGDDAGGGRDGIIDGMEREREREREGGVRGGGYRTVGSKQGGRRRRRRGVNVTQR